MNLRDLLASYNSGVLRARQEYALNGGSMCGTVAGYRRHKRADTVPCEPCREAFNARQRAMWAARKGGAA